MSILIIGCGSEGATVDRANQPLECIDTVAEYLDFNKVNNYASDLEALEAGEEQAGPGYTDTIFFFDGSEGCGRSVIITTDYKAGLQ